MSALSPSQRAALLRLAGDYVPSSVAGMTTHQTHASIARRGLIVWAYNGTGGWHLTDAGRAEVERLRDKAVSR